MKNTVETLVEGSPATLVELSVLGAHIVSNAVLRPNKRIRMTLRDQETVAAYSATVVWAKFEPSQGGATYRGGLEFTNADAVTLAKLCKATRSEPPQSGARSHSPITDPSLKIVSSRSDPVEMIVTGTRLASSRRAT
jgi:hypothetical protein